MVSGMILIDLQKAFDTIDHNILLKKMKFMGFADSTISWFRSYLTNRLFLVNIRDTLSDPCVISCGVPQGSILGPLLFLLYVNDMPQAVQSDLLLYADDTCLVYSDKNVLNIEKQLNNDFNSVTGLKITNSAFILVKKKPKVFCSQTERKRNPLLLNEETP